ncbi:MAG: MAPEG family protein [Gammaproteobacteria bacterium]|nr:MAPEG family protein [Gammaproteobacteria bacterium]
MLVALSLWVVASVRISGKISLGDGANPKFTPIIRAQANFVEYVPITLVLMGIAEINGVSPTWIHGLGIALVIARLIHPFGLASHYGINVLRVAGAVLTMTTLSVAAILCLRIYVNAG